MRVRCPLRRCVAAASVAGLLTACTWQTPPLEPPPFSAQTSKIMAANGQELVSLHAEQDREVVPLASMPKFLTDAVVAIEDERFWTHPGVDVRGLARAAARNADDGPATAGADGSQPAREDGIEQGGSTITQQYVKNVLLTREKTVDRKIAEAALAIRVERSYTKERILELYLNTIYFGAGAYGVQAAARTYFGKPVGQLSVAEAATLAGLIRSPSATDPFQHPDAALARRQVVLAKMRSLGWLAPADEEAAAAMPLGLGAPPAQRYPAGYFVEQVKRFILDDPRFGATAQQRRDLLFKGGLRITTTLDPAMQAQAEAARTAVLPDNGASQPSVALVSIEPSTGYVRALVGGRDFFGPGASDRFDLATQGSRPAGSSFKPLVLAAALEHGVPVSTTFPAPAHLDIPLPPGNGPDPVWKVDNYDADEAAAQMDLTEATVHSVNTVYAQLILQVGPQEAVNLAARMGISAPLQPYPSAVLGTNDVSPLDMADAYATLANEGVHVAPTFVTKVAAADGTVLFEAQHAENRVLDAPVADQVTGILRQVVQRGTGRAAAVPGADVAGKTGTGQEWRDAWFVGFTPQLATSVWVGYADRARSMVPPATPMRVTGGSWPAQIWQRYMAAALPLAVGAPAPTTTTVPSTTTTVPPTTTTLLPGQTLPATTTLPTTTMALGPPAPVPSVLGMTEGDATAALAAAGFGITVTVVADPVVPIGLVSSQSPGGNELAPTGSAVAVTISNGPPQR